MPSISYGHTATCGIHDMRSYVGKFVYDVQNLLFIARYDSFQINNNLSIVLTIIKHFSNDLGFFISIMFQDRA